MKNLIRFFMILCWVGCSRQVPIDNIEKQPKISAEDAAFSDVYQSLDGRWKGRFTIYEDTASRPKKADLLQELSPEILATLPLLQTSSLEVEQVYSSVSPYFQTVKITDYYPSTGKTVTSVGVNKVQDGKMWCVVRKPDETVIHQGALAAPETITWQRSESNPQKVEYFWETVGAETYEIIGWGYYEGDDLELMPRYWFYGLYTRQ